MNQVVIDPYNRGTLVGGPRPIAQLPPDARKHGFVADLSRCKAGDLILSGSIKPSLIDWQIFKRQAFATEDAQSARFFWAPMGIAKDANRR
jgi:hypothetical protein